MAKNSDGLGGAIGEALFDRSSISNLCHLLTQKSESIIVPYDANQG